MFFKRTFTLVFLSLYFPLVSSGSNLVIIWLKIYVNEHLQDMEAHLVCLPLLGDVNFDLSVKMFCFFFYCIIIFLLYLKAIVGRKHCD